MTYRIDSFMVKIYLNIEMIMKKVRNKSCKIQNSNKWTAG